MTPARLAGGERFAPRLRTEVVRGAGHFLPDEQPQTVLRLIREALDA